MEITSFEIILIFFALLFFLLFLSSVILHIWMIFDCLIKEKDSSKRIFWLFVIIAFGTIGSILYLVIRRPKRKLEQSDPEYSSDLEERILSKFYRIKVPPGPMPQDRKITRKRAMFQWNIMNFFSFLFIIIIMIAGVIFIYQSILSMDSDVGVDEDPKYLVIFFSTIITCTLGVALISALWDPRRGWNEYYLIGIRKRLLGRKLLELGYEETGDDYFSKIHGRGVHIRLSSIDPKWECPVDDIPEIGRSQDVMFIQVFACSKTSGPSMRILEYFPIGPFKIKLKISPLLIEQFQEFGAERIYDCTFKDVDKLIF